jgi:hypothetical protein
MSRDLAGAIKASQRLRDAAVRESGARLSAGDREMIDGFGREVDAQFRELATHLGFLVERDDPHSADGAETAATAPAN